MANSRLTAIVLDRDDHALERERDHLRSELDRLTKRLNLIQAELFARKRNRARVAAERKRDALTIAKAHGPKTLAAVRKMKFSDAITAKQKGIARQLGKMAQKARAKHSADAT